MKVLLLVFVMHLTLIAEEPNYGSLTQKIIQDLEYIYQGKAWTGASTYAKAREFRYRFKAISAYEIEITRNIDGVCLEEPFIIDVRDDYAVELEPDTKCDPALVISRELDIIYLYVKDRCGNYGGFNLYKRAEDVSVMLKKHLSQGSKLDD